MPKNQLSPAQSLQSLIESQIEKCGTISFSEFMETALYHPDLGYYSKHADSPDYYTNVDVHPIFAEILGRFFYQEWKNNFKSQKPFTILELGAGRGKLAGQILSWLKLHRQDFYDALTYICVERGAARKKDCEALAQEFPGRLKASDKFDFPAASLTGIIFSNEFFDALPFERVLRKGNRLKEIKIGSHFQEILSDLTPASKNYFDWLEKMPEPDCVAEAQIAAREWMAKIASALKKGLVLTIDYGFEARELFLDIRSQGTAICHFRHKTNRDFYSNLGNQDITCHVNFTALIKEGESRGLKEARLLSQTEFIAENGLEDAAKKVNEAANPRERLKISSAIKSLIHPEGMGGIFKVLIQHK